MTPSRGVALLLSDPDELARRLLAMTEDEKTILQVLIQEELRKSNHRIQAYLESLSK